MVSFLSVCQAEYFLYTAFPFCIRGYFAREMGCFVQSLDSVLKAHGLD